MRHLILPIAAAGFIFAFAQPRQADGGDPIKILNLEKLNTDADEEDPCPTADGLGMLYAVKGKQNYDIFLASKKTAKDVFPAGRPFIANRGADARSPFMYKDKYYFATNEVPDPKFAKMKNFDLFMQVGFQKPAPMLGDLNSMMDEMYPWITPAGKEFYFSRKTDEGWMLFVAKGPVPGPVGNAKAVGFPADFHRATIGGNGLTMYLQGPLEKGKIGIFRSKRAKAGDPWSRPEPLAPLNHAESKKGDMQPAVSADGARLYFVSDRPGGKGGLDIWTVATASLK